MSTPDIPTDPDNDNKPSQASDDAQPKKPLPFLSASGVESQDVTAGRVYWFVMAVLCCVILTAGVQNVKQVLHRHELYRKLATARAEHQRLITEEQRLLIEQQTLSATPIVAKRAKAELLMDYPDEHQRIMVLAPTGIK